MQKVEALVLIYSCYNPEQFCFNYRDQSLADQPPPPPYNSGASFARNLFAEKHAHHLLHALTCHHRSLPALELGKLVNIPFRRAVFQGKLDVGVPHAERQVRIRALVPDEPILAFEHVVQHTDDTLELISVAFLSAGKLLLVEYVEPSRTEGLDLKRRNMHLCSQSHLPCRLSEVRALTLGIVY